MAGTLGITSEPPPAREKLELPLVISQPARNISEYFSCIFTYAYNLCFKTVEVYCIENPHTSLILAGGQCNVYKHFDTE